MELLIFGNVSCVEVKSELHRKRQRSEFKI